MNAKEFHKHYPNWNGQERFDRFYWSRPAMQVEEKIHLYDQAGKYLITAIVPAIIRQHTLLIWNNRLFGKSPSDNKFYERSVAVATSEVVELGTL